MNYSTLSKIEQLLKNASEDPRSAVNEIEFFHYIVKLAIEDLHDPNFTIRENAHWWIFEDRLEGIYSTLGYISFQGACDVLRINPGWARQVIKNSSENGLGHRRQKRKAA